jgi:hypothetical protein
MSLPSLTWAERPCPRTRDVFGWSLERSNEWLLAHASAAVLRTGEPA